MSVAGSFPFAANIAPLFEPTPSARRRGVGGIARDIAARAYASAADHDEDGAYPAADVAALHEGGLLAAALPREWGGAGIGVLALCEVLREIGSGSLPLGRLSFAMVIPGVAVRRKCTILTGCEPGAIDRLVSSGAFRSR